MSKLNQVLSSTNKKSTVRLSAPFLLTAHDNSKRNNQIKVTGEMVSKIVGSIKDSDINLIVDNAPMMETMEDVLLHVYARMNKFHVCPDCQLVTSHDKYCESEDCFSEPANFTSLNKPSKAMFLYSGKLVTLEELTSLFAFSTALKG